MVNRDGGFNAREAARSKHKPERIRWLLIAEAPPDTLDRFFYFERVIEKDYLYIETMKVLFPGVSEVDLRARKRQYLQWFKEHGFYLIDVLDSPINGDTRSRDRKEMVWTNRGAVLSKLEELRTSITNETRIILIKASVYDLNAFLRRAGFNVANTNMIPFPSTGHQAEYREEMAKILKTTSRMEPEVEAPVEDDEDDLEAEEENGLPGELYPARLILDEYCSSFAGSLKGAGWDVRTVYDLGLVGKKPEDVASFARNNDALLVVRDEMIERAANGMGVRCVNISYALTLSISVSLSENNS